MVSFVPPVPGTCDGAVARTLASEMLIAWPSAIEGHVPPGQVALCSIALLGNTSVMVPSGETVLAASSLPIVTNNRAAPWNTPVVPNVKSGSGPSEVTIETCQSSCGPTPVASGG